MGYKHLQLIIRFPQNIPPQPFCCVQERLTNKPLKRLHPPRCWFAIAFFNPQPPVVLNQNIVRHHFCSYISVYAFFAVCNKLKAARESAFINADCLPNESDSCFRCSLWCSDGFLALHRGWLVLSSTATDFVFRYVSIQTYAQNWTFANKAALPSHVFKTTKLSLPGKFKQNICNKNASFCNQCRITFIINDLLFRAHRRNATNAVI